MTTILAALSQRDKKDECVRHALKVRSAWWLGNYHSFFALYRAAPRMAAFLMDWFIARERKNSLKQMIKSYVYFFWKISTFHLLIPNILSILLSSKYIFCHLFINDTKIIPTTFIHLEESFFHYRYAQILFHYTLFTMTR